MDVHYAIPADLSIPYDDIDAEHKILISILNSALDLIQTDQAMSQQLFDQHFVDFLSALTSHFKHEEQEMSDLKYPGLAEHRVSHLHCVRRFKDIRNAITAQQKEIGKKLLDEMFDVIIDDVIRADSGFKSFLHAQNVLR